ncbi:MAG: hypothetical protein U0Q07_03885 [Acidimicrobiales bacterium]
MLAVGAVLVVSAATGCSGAPEPTAASGSVGPSVSSGTAGSSPVGTSTPGTTPVAGSAVAGTTATCSWPVKANKETLNVAYPDTAATYWVQRYSLGPGERLDLGWTKPNARYSSFITYALTGGALDVRTDRDLEVGPDGTATVQLSADVQPHAGGNRIAATGTATNAAGTAIDNTAGPGATAAPTTTTTASGGRADGTVIYRVYVSGDPGDPAGGPLPTVTVVRADGGRQELPPCSNPGGSADAAALVDRFGPATNVPPPAQPVFIRPANGGGNLYPNPDNVYVATIVGYQPGRVVVVRGKAPTFPDTRAGKPVTGDEQVRYWSLCTNEYRKPYPVSFCKHDDEVALDASGDYTFVVSTPGDRPANATEGNGVTWLDWGSTDVNGLLLLRNMLASPSFPESATNLKPGSLASSTMGAYAPKAVYCDKATFEQGGASACGL